MQILIVLSNNDYVPNSNIGQRSGINLSEYGHFYRQAMQIGNRFIVASPDGGVVPIDPSSMDFEKDEQNHNLIPLKDRIIQSLFQTIALENAGSNKFDAVMIVGDHGDLMHNRLLAEIIQRTHNRGGNVVDHRRH